MKSARDKQMHAGGEGHELRIVVEGGECQVEHVRQALVAAVLEAREMEPDAKRPCGCGS